MISSARNQCLFGFQATFGCSHLNNYIKWQIECPMNKLEELLEFLAGHKTLAKGVGLGARSKETVDKQWNDLALRLNSFGSGSTKTGERWKKYWFDLKFKSKARLTRRRQDALATGGGPSNEDDLSEMDKKILDIIGEQAVYGDNEHRVPVFNIQAEVAVSAPVQPEDIVMSEEVIISDTAELPVPVDSPEAPEIQAQQVPERNQTGVEDPASQPARRLPDRPRRQNRPSLTNRSQTRIDPDWVMELERSRVQAENKMADAALIIAEAANKIAEASLLNAETSRRQLEVLNTMVDVVRQLSSGLAARPD